MTSLKKLVESQRVFYAPYKPSTVFRGGGVVLTIPQLFVSQSLRSIWSRDIRSRPIKTLHFTTDQSETVLKTVLKVRIPLLE